MSKSERVMPASRFKAECLHVLDDVAARRVGKVTVTKHGKPVVVVSPAPKVKGNGREPFVHGFMRGRVVIPDGFDFTEPTLGEPFNATK